MKALLSGNYSARTGFSTLEMLIAFAILIVTLSSVITIVFGNQSISIDADTSRTALSKATIDLETAVRRPETSFNLLSSVSSTDGIYTKALSVTDITPCEKHVIETLSWQTEGVRTHALNLGTLITNPRISFDLGGDCTIGNLSGDWLTPVLISSRSLSPQGGIPTDIDVIGNAAFIGNSDYSGTNQGLFAFDIRDPENPVPKGYFHTAYDIAAIDAISASDGNFYIFAAIATSTNQFQIFKTPRDLSSSPELIASRTLPGVTGTYPEGRSIFYYRNKIYMGTHRTAGNEFHVYNVQSPTNPLHIGRIELNHNVNDIAVRDEIFNGVSSTLAYLATSANNDDLMVLDVTNPASINEILAGNVNLTGNEDSQKLFLLGNKLYVGRSKSTGAHIPPDPDFYILDTSNPATGLPILGSFYTSAKTINGIRVNGSYAFLGTGDSTNGFYMLDISDPADIKLLGSYAFSGPTNGIDYENNALYAISASGNTLRVIGPTP